MLEQYILKLQHRDLTADDAQKMLVAMTAEHACPEQIAACMALLHFGALTEDIFVGVVKGLQQSMKRVYVDVPLLDIVGTGGDGAHTVNISTGSALLLASMGVKVAKHGNRAASSLCGSADVLEALSIPIEYTCTQAIEALQKFNFAYFYAPLFHPAKMSLRHVRKALGVPSVFNLTGPLLNPASAEYMLIGVYKPSIMPLYANVLKQLPIKKALVFHCAGTDELLPVAPAQALMIENGRVRELVLDAKNYGIARCEVRDLRGGDAYVNAEKLLAVFSCDKNAIADTLMFNAAVAADLYGKVDSIQDGVELARQCLAQGAVLKLIDSLRGERDE